jgi:hypothetical protein
MFLLREIDLPAEVSGMLAGTMVNWGVTEDKWRF